MNPTYREMPRAAGILLHPTSLPGPFGIGELGARGRAFVDWLEAAGISLWQVLPLVPTDSGGSPYSSWSAFAGNPDLIDIAELVELGLIDREAARPPELEPGLVDYGAAREARRPLLAAAAASLVGGRSSLTPELEAFRRNAPWAEETALFAAIKQQQQGQPWWFWPRALRERSPRALEATRQELAGAVEAEVALQFLCDRQWRTLKRYANAKHIQLVGDIPIYVDADSIDVWASPHLFELTADGRPVRVAGVPPDAFSDLGQRWGNPLYDWPAMAKEGFAWWQARLARALELTDWVRIDHFRGFAAYWAIPAELPDARVGEWMKGPGEAVFTELKKVAPTLPIIAEDLGVIDDSVRALLRSLGLPGMLVAQFAFGEDATNPYLPHNHRENAVAYTGTHDNDTTRGWWKAASENVRDHVRRYLGSDGRDVVWDLIRSTLGSVARFAIVPLQDVLELGSEARMNTPARATGNWRWRLKPGELQPEHARRLRELVTLYGRLPR